MDDENPKVLKRWEAMHFFGERDFRAALKAGKVERLLPGLYAATGEQFSWQEKLAGFLHWAGPDAVASFTAAARLYQLELKREYRPELTVPRSNAPENPLVKVHRSNVPPDEVWEVKGVPCTSPAWTVLDLASVIKDPLELAILVESAWRMRRWKLLDELERLIRSHGRGRPGASRLRPILADCRSRPRPFRSLKEVECWRFLQTRRDKIPMPCPLHEVRDREGKMEIDFAWPLQSLALELNGWASHKDKQEKDSKRQMRLAALGWRPSPLTVKHFDDDREHFFEILHRSLTIH